MANRGNKAFCRSASLAALCGSLSLGACSMTNSALVPPAGLEGCHSDLGAYFLPLDSLHVEVLEKDKRQPSATQNLVMIQVRSKADRSRGFCLDYLASPASNDFLTVRRNADGLLARVATTNKTYENIVAGDSEDGSDFFDLNRDLANDGLATDDRSKAIADEYNKNLLDTFGSPNATPKAGPGPYFTTDKFPDLIADADTKKRELEKQRRERDAVYCDPRKPDGGAKLATDKDPLWSAVCERNGVTGGYTPVATKHADRPYFFSPSNDPPRNPESYPRPGYLASKVDQMGDAANTGFSGDYDPSDPVEAANINSAMKRYGYCLILNDGTIDLRERNKYCDDPIGYVHRKGFKLNRADDVPPEGYVSYTEGLLYRPRLTYLLYVFRKDDVMLGGGWKLAGQERVRIANLSPMMAVGVKRTLFSSRNTIVTFDKGALQNIAIAKRSELANAVTIPLAIVKNVATLPTSVIQLRVVQTSALRDLADAQYRLLQAEEAELKARNALELERRKVTDTAPSTGGQPTAPATTTPAPATGTPGPTN